MRYYYYFKDYDEAINILESALKEIEYKQGFVYVETLAYLGYAYKNRSQFTASNKAFNLASKNFYDIIENLKKEGNLKNEIAFSYMRIAEIDSAQGNFKKSLANYKLFKAYQKNGRARQKNKSTYQSKQHTKARGRTTEPYRNGFARRFCFTGNTLWCIVQ